MTDVAAALPRFVFCVCQQGAENACKREVLSRHPFLAFAFSRPGFLTFKVADSTDLPESYDLRLTFARTSGWSLGKMEHADLGSVRTDLIEKIKSSAATCVHVWQRDVAFPGDGGFEPGTSELARSIAEEIRLQLAQSAVGDVALTPTIRVNQIADHGERVFDVAIVEPDSWWLGWHMAYSVPRCWPGGTPLMELAKPVVSRAYWKMSEAIAWSRLPIAAGQWCVEIGAAPGGACQFLLENGLHVIAVDPAEMDESVKSHPNLIHLLCRSREVRRVLLKDCKWLFADLNVAPNYTLDAVQDIVGSSKLRFQGLLLTLKMMNWELADDIPTFISRVREWGFESVHARQLAYNRREICVMALRS